MRHLLFLALVALAACSGTNPEGSAATNTAAAAATGIGTQGFGSDPRGPRAGQFGELARLPDRGELLSYPDGALARQDGAYTWHRAGVSEEHALRAVASRSLRVVTPSGEALDIEYDHHVEHSSGDWSWVGHLAGDKSAQTILTFGSNAVFGTIGQAGKRSLRLTSRDGAAWLVETDPGKLVGLASEGANPSKPDHLAIPRQLLSKGGVRTASARPSSAVSAAAAAAPITIDVLVGYTGGIASRTGSASAALTLINSLVAITNEAYATSQVNARVRLVRAMQVNYTDASSNESTLEQLTGYDVSEQQFITPNAAFNSLRAAREQYGADLVVLLRQFQDPEQDGCGIAWLIGGGKSGVTPGDGQDDFGYSVVSDGQDRNEQDGQTYYCRPESFAHELGHNMGSAHERASAMGDDGVLDDPDDYGAFAYSFGYKTGAAAGNFFTIMAYGDAGQQDYRVFSNPRITLPCGNRACGTANDDNARSLGQIMPVVATFRAAVLPIAGRFDDFNGDGLSDILWRNYQTGVNTIWNGGNSAVRIPVTGVSAISWRVVGIGDFNGDGVSDILWRNTSSGSNVIWRSGNYAMQQPVAYVPPPSWMVAGIGDFDGDGRSDILWRNTSSGANAIWKSGDSATPQPITAVTSQSWQIAAVGDFNGDSRSDIVWRDFSTGANALWWSGSFATRTALGKVSDLRWKVVGAGDLDGNGSADLVWRHSATGANSVWPAGDSRRGVNFTAVTDQRWQVERIADYNGDAQFDLLWRNAATGDGTIWLSANFATRRSISNVPGPYWQIAP